MEAIAVPVRVARCTYAGLVVSTGMTARAAVGVILLVAAVAFAAVWWGTPQGDGSRPAEAAFGRGEVVLSGPAGQHEEMAVYIADSPGLWRQGLMGWEELPDGEGMLFAFDGDRGRGFWMKDTLLHLSVAFTDAEGRVHAVMDMEPCERDPCPRYTPEDPYRYALEVEQGVFDTLGLEPGWRIVPAYDER